jgi:hypothetical protein
MGVSLCGREVQAMDWLAIFNIWSAMKHQRIIELDISLD